MKRASENQGNPGKLADYFSPKSKGMDFALQQYSIPHFTSFPQETPMKPSQVQNLLSHPPPRRILPIQTPEQYNRDKYGQKSHPPHSTGPIYSTGFVPHNSDGPPANPFPNDRLVPSKHLIEPSEFSSSSPPYTGSSVYGCELTPRERLGSLLQAVQLEPIHFSSSQYGPTSSTNSSTSNDGSGPPGAFNPASSKFVKTLSYHFPSHHISRDQQTKSKVVSSHSGCNNETATKQDSNKSPQQQHKRTPSSARINPAMDLNCTSQKRHREFEHSSENSKKICPQGPSSNKTQTNIPIPDNTSSTFLVFNSPKNSLGLEQAPKTADRHTHTELVCGQSTYSSTFKSTHSHSTSSPKHCTKGEPSKQAHIDSTDKNVGKPSALSKSNEKSVKRNEENHKSDKTSTFAVPQKEHCKSPHTGSVSIHSGHGAGGIPNKTPSRDSHLGESRKSVSNSLKLTPKPHSDSPGSRTVDRSKTSRVRKSVPDDLSDLFTPDPMVKVTHAHKTPNPKMEEKMVISPTSEKVSCPTFSNSTPVLGSTSLKTSYSRVTASPVVVPSSTCNLVSLPNVTLKRVTLEKSNHCSKGQGLKRSPFASSSKQITDNSVKSKDKKTPLLSRNASSCHVETDTATSEQTSLSQCTLTRPQERQDKEGNKEDVNEDHIDVELDLGLSIAYDVDLTQSSISSEEEPLISLKEMMECVTKPPDTPEKGTFSEPTTPVCRSTQQKTLLPSSTKPGLYKNSLDQMLTEMNNNKRAKEVEAELLITCKEEMLKITQYEEEHQEEGISAEQQEFLQRYSLMTSAIRDVPPGEVVFNLDKFGRIFNQNTLELRQCMVNPQWTAQKTLLWSSPAQLRLHVNIGLFQEAYDCNLPCPAQVTRFLFKMMSVHSERMLSEKMLQALCDIACSAAYQLVNNGSQQFEVWVPSLADVTLVLMNMGVDFVTLFPFEDLQPPFTEGDLLEDVPIKTESSSTDKEQMIFPEHNCSNIFKYLSFCMGLCPHAYSDNELLMLLTMVGTVSLDTQRILQSSMEVTSLQYKIVNNIRDWGTLLPRICQALTDLTNDHHNMCLLVQLLPDNTRGKELRQHLSLSMISKLLDGTCTYKPLQNQFKLAELRPYVPRMQPSALLRGLQKDKEEDMATLDPQAYYLCSSLLTLTNEASNLQFFPPHQKEQLLLLSSELETHVKCDIRESEKCLYRSKVKDLVARIYTKWQMVLQRTRPLNGKLYDYWQPVDTFRGNQDDEENIVTEDETTSSDEDEDDVLSADEIETEKEEVLEAEEVMEVDDGSGGTEEDFSKVDANRTEEANEPVTVDLNQVAPELQPQALDEQTDAGIDIAEMEKTA